MSDAPKPIDTSLSGLDFLHSVIREQQDALDGLESSRRELESVVEHLLVSRRNANTHRPVQDGVHSGHAAITETRSSLSKREIQVLRLMVEGKTSREIAADLGISFKTAVTHRASIMSKLDVHETASVVREAIRRGLV